VTDENSAESPTPVRVIAERLAAYIDRLGSVWVEGQVAQFKARPGSGYQYFTLRDLSADMSISVMIASAKITALSPPFEAGQRVVVFAKPNFWTKNGSLTMRASELRAVGLGDLLAQLARLKDLLATEGLFAPERKQPIPFLPRRIGLICGRASDAMHDVLVNARERWPGIPFEVREVAVQGVNAVTDVMGALAELDADPDVDVIVITRGGGSLEDLLPFSNEALVRAVADARTPIVSAIGHEQDNPLIDFVADLRASTPTDAAKRIVPSFAEQQAIVQDLRQRARRTLQNTVEVNEQRVSDQRARMRTAIRHRIEREEQRVEHLLAQVRTLSPQATLDRGYAIALLADGQIIRDEQVVPLGATIGIRVAHGRLTATRIAEESA
jgi:exodeoxyribonuclease VII large subunit